MELNRRDFVRTVLAGAIAVSVPAFATMTETGVPAIPAAHPHQHIIDALKLYDEFLVAMNNHIGYKRITGKKSESMYEKMHLTMDALFDHIHATFKYERSEEAFNAVATMLRGEHLPNEADLRKIPPVIVEAAWPVFMMKTILRDRAAPINHRELKSFKEFHDRYGVYILCDTWKEAEASFARKA